MRRMSRSGSFLSSSSSVVVRSSGGSEFACFSVRRSMACVLVNASETARVRGGRVEEDGKDSGDGGGDGEGEALLPFPNGGGW